MAERKAWSWAFDGDCKPAPGENMFSVGIFQWVPKKGGKGVKRSKAVCRVNGSVEEADQVYQRAEEICGFFNKWWDTNGPTKAVK